MQRRDFISIAAAVGTVAAASSLPVHAQSAAAVSGDQRAKAKLRFCSMLGVIPGNNDEAKLKWMKANGFEAVEVGDPGNMESAKNWKKKADDAGLEIASIYFGGAEHPLMSEDSAVRQKGIDESKAKMEIAAAIDCPVLVYVPVRGSQPDAVKNLPERVLWERTVGVLKDIGPMAAALKTNVILEPLRRGEAWFMRQVSQAACLAREAGVPGVGVLGDTYHMYTEEANNMAAFIAGGEYVKHVHIGSGEGRVLPTAENHSAKGRTHTDAFRGLKYIGYTRFISFECGVGGSGNGAVEVPKCLDYFRKCWDEA
ncbi:MAG: sugar phosphate isomerase/epimerase [Planctomycetaceae bacterium]|jgi:sugar phosphate isomerase/epimerase|nr:sugar phosphate isomerase/epimerase [Planctomycetaceae bacterium]